MTKQRVLTGITTTGTPHLGNYVGAIAPAIENSKSSEVDAFYFLADYHALIKCHDPKQVHQSSIEIAASWMALGLDTDSATFYRQSDIPEIPELAWIISCMTAKGLMNRAHAYKAAVQHNEDSGSKDPDKGITMGLFGYPVLMAADILMFNANKVPVGKDQIQHIEMARDIAGRFNHHYGNIFSMPEAVVDDKTELLKGLDGRKMSKSYNNTIPLFVPQKKLRKLINKIVTNSLEPGEPKDWSTCTLFEIYSAFAKAGEIEAVKKQYEEGIGWGDMKKQLFEYVDATICDARERYVDLLENKDHIEQTLKIGAEKARAQATPLIDSVRKAVGIAPIA